MGVGGWRVGGWSPNSDALDEQCVLITPEPTLQPLNVLHLQCFIHSVFYLHILITHRNGCHHGIFTCVSDVF